MTKQPERRDMEAVALLFEEFRPRLLAVVHRRLSPDLAARIDPEDVLTDAYLEACRRWSAVGPLAVPPYVWLYGLVRDRVLAERRRHPRREVALSQQAARQWSDLIGSGSNPADAAARRDEAVRVQQVIELLDEKEREVLEMRHFDGLQHDEIAEVLRISLSAAEKRYQRALGRLAGLWRQLNPDAGTPP